MAVNSGLTGLTGLGTCSYGNVAGGSATSYTFSPAMETVGIEITPHEDQAGRTIVYSSVVLTLKDYVTITGPFTTDSTMDQIKAILLRDGDILQYSNKGFGDFSINTGNNFGVVTKDVMWGPHPKRFSPKLEGRNQAWSFVWTVEVNFMRCGGVAGPFSLALLESNFAVGYSYDRSSLCTRTVSGYLRIPQTRATVTTRTLGDNADNYRPVIVPQSPPGFRRIPGSFTLSDDKCKLTYNIIDEELPSVNIPPPGVIECSLSHSTKSGGPVTFTWNNTISASYEVAKGLDKSAVLVYFNNVTQLRKAAAKAAGAQVLQRAWDFNEVEAYGKRTATCSCSYDIIKCTLNNILSASGLWTPMPDSNYALWTASLNNHIFRADGRGFSGAGFQNGGDLIVDVCGNASPTVVDAANGLAAALAPAAALGVFPDEDYPDPNFSYLDYRLASLVVLDDEIIELKPLPASSPVAPPYSPNVSISVVPQGSGGSLLDNTPSDSVTASQESANQATLPYQNAGGGPIITPQQRVGPTVEVWLVGVAERAGYDIPAPQLVSFGGVTPVQANRAEWGCGFSRYQKENLFGVPIIKATWALRWIMPSVPNQAPPVYPMLAGVS